jgi:hypothetical protein
VLISAQIRRHGAKNWLIVTSVSKVCSSRRIVRTCSWSPRLGLGMRRPTGSVKARSTDQPRQFTRFIRSGRGTPKTSAHSGKVSELP